MGAAASCWPDLPYLTWRDTATTLQLWTQIVGKVRLQLTPWVNHSWQVPLYVTARGLGTSPVHVGNEILEFEFDFIRHCLLARTSRGEEETSALEPQTVADFYRAVLDLLEGLGVGVAINETPNEVASPIRFSEDRTHAAYDGATAHRFWRTLVEVDRVFKLFRSGFLARSAQSTSSGAALISRLPVSLDGRPRSTRAAFPDCRTPLRARPTRTR